MSADDFYHYNILYLQPGASQKEIHSAYRHLVKLYHPDQDHSLYAEVRYKEIRTAYDVLRHKVNASPETDAASYAPPPYYQPRNADYGAAGRQKYESTAKHHETIYGNGWWYVEDAGEGEDSFDFSDLMWEYGGRTRPKKRLPFSPGNLPDILRTSFNEVFGIGMTIRVVLMTWSFWGMLSEIGWSGISKVSIILCILLCGLLYRYYFPCPPQYPVANIVGSLLFSLVFGIVCTATANRRMLSSGILSEIYLFCVAIFIHLLLLWAHPFRWGSAENSGRGRY
jgi:hypothetical protein